MKQKLVLAIIAGVVMSAGAWSFGAVSPRPQTWEYRFQEDCASANANVLGAAGWELVTMDPSSSHRQCIFKRPLP